MRSTVIVAVAAVLLSGLVAEAAAEESTWQEESFGTTFLAIGSADDHKLVLYCKGPSIALNFEIPKARLEEQLKGLSAPISSS